MRPAAARYAVCAVVAGSSLFAACSSDGEKGAPPSVDSIATVAPESVPPTSIAASADPSPVAGGDGSSPLGGDAATGDHVEFVTTTSTTTTTTTTTTTLPPTTTTRPTTTTSSTTLPPTTTTRPSTTTSTSTSTTSTVPAPTSIRCSFSADAVFEPGSSVLTADASDELVALVTGVDDVRTVRIEGHTDYRGTDADNVTLSQQRADAAAAALVDAGVAERIITSIGLGEQDAHQESPSDGEMAADRRVDVVIDATVPITTTC